MLRRNAFAHELNSKLESVTRENCTDAGYRVRDGMGGSRSGNRRHTIPRLPDLRRGMRPDCQWLSCKGRGLWSTAFTGDGNPACPRSRASKSSSKREGKTRADDTDSDGRMVRSGSCCYSATGLSRSGHTASWPGRMRSSGLSRACHRRNSGCGQSMGWQVRVCRLGR